MPVLPKIKRIRAGGKNGLVDLMLRDGATGIWLLNEVNGTTAADVLNTNAGTYAGGFTLAQQGPLARMTSGGGGVSFNGTSGTCTAGVTGFTALTAYTYEFWQFCASAPSSLVSNLMFQIGSTNNSCGFNWDHTNATFRFAAQQQNSGGSFFAAKPPSTPLANQWNHIAVTWNGTTLTCYLNGVAGTGTAVASLKTVAGNITVASDGRGGFGPSCSVSSIAIYPTAQSANQIKSHFLAGSIGA